MDLGYYNGTATGWTDSTSTTIGTATYGVTSGDTIYVTMGQTPTVKKNKTSAKGWLDDELERVCAKGRKVEASWQ